MSSSSSRAAPLRVLESVAALALLRAQLTTTAGALWRLEFLGGHRIVSALGLVAHWTVDRVRSDSPVGHLNAPTTPLQM